MPEERGKASGGSLRVIRRVRGCRFRCIEPGAFELWLGAFSDGSINLLAYGILYGSSRVGYFDVRWERRFDGEWL